MRRELFNCRNSSTAVSSVVTSGLEVCPVNGSAAMTGVVKVRRYLYRAASRSKWPSHGPQPRHADARTDQLPDLLVGNRWVSEHVKRVVEQPATLDLGARTVHDPLGQLVTRPRVRAGQRLIE